MTAVEATQRRAVAEAIMQTLDQQGRTQRWFYTHPLIDLPRWQWEKIKSGLCLVPESLPANAALVLGVPVASLTAPAQPTALGHEGGANDEGPAVATDDAGPS